MSMSEQVQALIKRATEETQASVERLMAKAAKDNGIEIVIEQPARPELPDVNAEQKKALAKHVAEYAAAQATVNKAIVQAIEGFESMNAAIRAAKEVANGTKQEGTPAGFPFDGVALHLRKVKCVLDSWWNSRIIGMNRDGFDAVRELERNY